MKNFFFEWWLNWPLNVLNRRLSSNCEQEVNGPHRSPAKHFQAKNKLEQIYVHVQFSRLDKSYYNILRWKQSVIFHLNKVWLNLAQRFGIELTVFKCRHCIFAKTVYCSHWKRVWPFICINLNPFRTYMFCANFGYTWPLGSGEEDLKMSSMYFHFIAIISLHITLIAIVLSDLTLQSYATAVVLFILWQGTWYANMSPSQRSQWRVSDTQVTVKALGPLVFPIYLFNVAQFAQGVLTYLKKWEI